MTNNDQLITDLRRARDILAQRGRCVNTLEDSAGRLCMMGAIHVSIASELNMAVNFGRRRSDVVKALSAQLKGMHGPEQIWQYNDDSKTTDQDALNLFDKTLAHLGGLG